MISNALTLGLVAALAWGFHDFAVRLSTRKQPIMLTLLSVLFFGMLFQSLLIGFTGGISMIPPRAIGLSVLAGFCFLAASIGLYAAFKRGPVKLVAPILGSYPIVSLLLAEWSGVTHTLAEWGAVAAIVCGIAAVALTSGRDERTDYPILPTIGISALSMACFALTFSFGQDAASISDERLTVAVTRIVALAVLWVALLAGRCRIMPDRKALPLLVFMGLMDTIALFCVLSAGGLDGAHFASAASSVFGVVTILLAAAFLKERLTPPQWCGVAVAFGGIAYLAA